MSSTTTKHVARFSHGALVVSVTEASDAVHVYIKSPTLKDSERLRLVSFLFPIIHKYGEDPRPMHYAGNLAEWSATIYGTNSQGAACVVMPAAARGAVQ